MSVLHRKATAGIAAGLALLTLVAGCGSAKAPTDAGAKSSASTKPIELTVQTFPGISAATMANVNTEFTAKHPNVKVTLKEGAGKLPGPSVDASDLDGVDVLFTNEGQVSSLVEAKLVKDLTAVKLPQLNDGVANIFGDLGKVNGKRYALPVSVEPTQILINPDAITKAGVKVPSVDWTWQDFQQALTATKDAGSQNQVMLQGILESILRAYGGLLYDVDKQQYAFDSAEAKQALTALQPFVRNNLAMTSASGPIVVSKGPGGSGPAFTALGGKIMILGGQTTSLPYPKGPKGRPSPVSATVAVVSASSPNADMATEYVKTLLNEPAEQMALAKGGVRPVTNDAKALAAWQQAVGDQTAQAVEAGLPDVYQPAAGPKPTGDVITGLMPYLNGTAALDTTISGLMASLNK